jgi:hypothetical protein
MGHWDAQGLFSSFVKYPLTPSTFSVLFQSFVSAQSGNPGMTRGIRADPLVRAGVKLQLQQGISYRKIAAAFNVSLGFVARCNKELVHTAPFHGSMDRNCLCSIFL